MNENGSSVKFKKLTIKPPTPDDETTKCINDSVKETRKKEFGDLIYKIIEDGNVYLVSSDNIDKVIKEILKQKSLAQKVNNRRRMKQMNNVLRDVMRYNSEQCYIEYEEMRYDEYSEKLFRTYQDLDYLEEHWDHVIACCTEKKRQAMEKLIQKYNDNIAEYDKKYDEEPPKMNSYTPEIVELRDKQKRLGRAHMFKEAAQCQRMADELMEKEHNKNIAKWHSYLDQNRQILIKKQNKHIEIRRSFWDKVLKKIQTLKATEIRNAKMSVDYLENGISKTQNLSQSCRATSRRSFARTAPVSERKSLSKRVSQVAYSPVILPKLARSLPVTPRFK